MNAVDVYAPGKLFVIGEYAVLHGGRALVAAIDAGICCRAEPASAWRLSAPDLGVDAALEDLPAGSAGSLLASAVVAVREELAIDRPLSFHVRGTQSASRGKYGLGGSAASVVAILGAAAAANGMDLETKSARARLFSLGLAVHRRHQRGRGSGADVAASVYGGWVDYALAEGGAHIAPAPLPAAIRLATAWSGMASDTVRAIEEFETQTALARLRPVLERFWSAAARDDRLALLQEIDAYGSALAELAGAAAGARRIAELVRAARGLGFAAKGSGAVGGDCAIAVAFAPVDFAPLEAQWRKAQAEPLALSIDTRGIRLRSEDVDA